MRSSGIKIAALLLVGMILLVSTFSVGIICGLVIPRASQAFSSAPTAAAPVNAPTLQSPTAQPSTEPSAQPTAAPDSSAAEPDLFAPFWEAWSIVHDEFIDQPVNDVALMRGAIKGMLDSLGDPHTSYMDPDEYTQANIDMSGEYEGIGAWVDITGEYLSIISPMPGSPAEEAGLKPGDIVIAVDGKDMTGVDGNLVIQKIMGPANSSVVLNIQRGTEEPFDVTLTRAKITVPSVESKMLDGNIGYIHLYTFGDNSTDEIKAALETLLAQNPKGLILDLRYNGGGYLSTSIEIASQFIGSGSILYEEYSDGTRTSYDAYPGGLATDIPLVVLVNEGTASASEIVAGAIQDYGRGKLVGVTTYGKGSVQTWVELQNNQGAVRVTVAHWLTPKERQINGVGLTPDVTVELTEEDVANEKDTQLDKAIELLTNP